MRARIHVTLKPGVLDAEGRAIGQALGRLGFAGVGEVRTGRFFDVEVGGEFADAAAQVEAMCRALLANPVIEDYRFTIGDEDG